MKQRIIYCIPGMGTDKRVFQSLAAALPAWIELRYWEFVEPLAVDEPMDSYIGRCMETWEKPEGAEPPLVLGMSLGGILATEWAKRNPYSRLFLLSTVHLSAEMPAYFGMLRRLPLHRLVPTWLTRLSWGRWGKWLGITDGVGQALLRDMIHDMSLMHLRWGRNTAVHWQNAVPLANIVRIHGTRDHVFPFKRIQGCDYRIEGGTHCAVMNNAQMIADLLVKELNKNRDNAL